MVLMARLSNYGYEVTHAENGKTAVEMFPQIAPDLILMDIEMPVMNGFEATNRIRGIEATQQWAWTPILFLTASDTNENLVTAIEAGGDDFLAKTVPESVLQAKMKAMTRIATLRTRLSAANRKLAEQANQDGLTGLFNRRYLDLQIDAAWADATASGKSFGLLMIDIDNFKKYNDHYGHQEGDTCLRRVAQGIRSVVDDAIHAGFNQTAFTARYGGEEFSVVLPYIDPATFEGIALSIVEAIRQLAIPHEKNAEWGVVTVSVGGCRIEKANGLIGALFAQSDQALYRAKESGRNRFESSEI
jgi:diguanylate cyclase (GGDEF)-like protein